MDHAAFAAPPSDTPPFSALTPPLPSHPSYADMITAAIVWDSAQGKEGGSSRRAIAKYIDRVYNLPPSHSSLLTHHLKRLKSSGHLVMVKNSYQLASLSPAPAPPLTGSAPLPPSPTPKRRPGRPSKPQPAQPISSVNGPAQSSGKKRGRPSKHKIQPLDEQHQIVMAPAEVPFVQPQPQIPPNGLPAQKRRPGRPPKQAQPGPDVDQPVGVETAAVPEEGMGKRRRGRPVRYIAGGPVKPVAARSRGRPKRSLLGPVSRPLGKRPRGRPPKMGGVVDAGAGAGGVVFGKRRGRPPKGSGPLKLRKLSGKPLGRPKKDPSAVKHTSGLGMANEELTRRLELVQSKVRDAVGVLRPYVANENAALVALQQLEELVTPPAPPSPPPAAPPVMAAPITAIPPPSVSVPVPVSVAAAPNLTATQTGTVTAPVMNAPTPFSVNLPPMTVTAPFQAAPSINIQQPMSWMTTSRESQP